MTARFTAIQLQLHLIHVSHIGSIPLNNIAYADDVVIVSSSVKGLQILLSICQQYAGSHDVLYNATKSKVVMFPRVAEQCIERGDPARYGYTIIYYECGRL